MPTKDEHLRKATHNEKFFDDFNLASSAYPDWAITVLFYSALHYVEAFFAAQTPAIHCATHPQREGLINQHLRSIYGDYSDLKNDSLAARYGMKEFTRENITRDILPCFEVIKRRISSNPPN